MREKPKHASSSCAGVYSWYPERICCNLDSWQSVNTDSAASSFPIITPFLFSKLCFMEMLCTILNQLGSKCSCLLPILRRKMFFIINYFVNCSFFSGGVFFINLERFFYLFLVCLFFLNQKCVLCFLVPLLRPFIILPVM